MAKGKDLLKKAKEYVVDDTIKDFKKIGDNLTKGISKKKDGDDKDKSEPPKKKIEEATDGTGGQVKQIIVVKCMECPMSEFVGEELGDKAQILCKTVGAKGNGFVCTFGEGIEAPIPDWCPLNNYEGE